jgi:hypothetical protein
MATRKRRRKAKRKTKKTKRRKTRKGAARKTTARKTTARKTAARNAVRVIGLPRLRKMKVAIDDAMAEANAAIRAQKARRDDPFFDMNEALRIQRAQRTQREDPFFEMNEALARTRGTTSSKSPRKGIGLSKKRRAKKTKHRRWGDSDRDWAID